jgi:hypothetical protein
MNCCKYGSKLKLNIYSVTYHWAQLASFPTSLIQYNTLAYWFHSYEMKRYEYGPCTSSKAASCFTRIVDSARLISNGILELCGQCYKTFYARNLRMFVIR